MPEVLDTLSLLLKTEVDTTGLNDLNGRMREVRTSLNEVAEGLIGIGSRINRFSKSVIATVYNFELASNRIKGVFLERATNADLSRFENQARRLGRETSRTASDAAAAQLNLARAGLAVKEVYDALPSTLDLAIAGELSMSDASQLVHKQMRAFKLEADEANRVADVLAHTANTTATNVSELGPAFRQVAPAARAAGMQIEQVASMLGQLRNIGLAPGQAGTMLRAIISRMIQAPTGRATDAIHKLGLSWDTLRKQVTAGDLESAMTSLGEAGADVGDMVNIFGRRAYPAALGLLEAARDGLLRSERVEEGYVNRVRRAIESGFPGAMIRFKSAVEELQIAIGRSGLVGVLTDFLVIGKDIVNWLSSSAGWLRTFTAGVMVTGGAMVVLGLIFKVVAWQVGIFRSVKELANRQLLFGRVLWLKEKSAIVAHRSAMLLSISTQSVANAQSREHARLMAAQTLARWKDVVATRAQATSEMMRAAVFGFGGARGIGGVSRLRRAQQLDAANAATARGARAGAQGARSAAGMAELGLFGAMAGVEFAQLRADRSARDRRASGIAAQEYQAIGTQNELDNFIKERRKSIDAEAARARMQLATAQKVLDPLEKQESVRRARVGKELADLAEKRDQQAVRMIAADSNVYTKALKEREELVRGITGQGLSASDERGLIADLRQEQGDIKKLKARQQQAQARLQAARTAAGISPDVTLQQAAQDPKFVAALREQDLGAKVGGQYLYYDKRITEQMRLLENQLDNVNDDYLKAKGVQTTAAQNLSKIESQLEDPLMRRQALEERHIAQAKTQVAKAHRNGELADDIHYKTLERARIEDQLNKERKELSALHKKGLEYTTDETDSLKRAQVAADDYADNRVRSASALEANRRMATRDAVSAVEAGRAPTPGFMRRYGDAIFGAVAAAPFLPGIKRRISGSVPRFGRDTSVPIPAFPASTRGPQGRFMKKADAMQQASLNQNAHRLYRDREMWKQGATARVDRAGSAIRAVPAITAMTAAMAAENLVSLIGTKRMREQQLARLSNVHAAHAQSAAIHKETLAQKISNVAKSIGTKITTLYSSVIGFNSLAKIKSAKASAVSSLAEHKNSAARAASAAATATNTAITSVNTGAIGANAHAAMMAGNAYFTGAAARAADTAATVANTGATAANTGAQQSNILLRILGVTWTVISTVTQYAWNVATFTGGLLMKWQIAIMLKWTAGKILSNTLMRIGIVQRAVENAQILYGNVLRKIETILRGQGNASLIVTIMLTAKVIALYTLEAVWTVIVNTLRVVGNVLQSIGNALVAVAIALGISKVQIDRLRAAGEYILIAVTFIRIAVTQSLLFLIAVLINRELANAIATRIGTTAKLESIIVTWQSFFAKYAETLVTIKSTIATVINTVVRWANTIAVLVGAAALWGWVGAALAAVGAAGILSTAWAILNAIMWANPVFFIIGAIVALIAVVYFFWDKIKKVFSAVIDVIKSVFEGGFTRILSNIWNLILSFGKKVVNFFKSLPGKVWGGIKSVFGFGGGGDNAEQTAASLADSLQSATANINLNPVASQTPLSNVSNSQVINNSNVDNTQDVTIENINVDARGQDGAGIAHQLDTELRHASYSLGNPARG